MIRKKIFDNAKFEINVVPFIDIILILMLILILIKPIKFQKIEVKLPKTDYFSCIEKKKVPTIIIEASMTNEYNLIIDYRKKKKINLEDSIEKISSYMQKFPKTTLYIVGEKHVPYGNIIKIMNLLKKFKIKSVNLLTRY